MVVSLPATSAMCWPLTVDEVVECEIAEVGAADAEENSRGEPAVAMAKDAASARATTETSAFAIRFPTGLRGGRVLPDRLATVLAALRSLRCATARLRAARRDRLVDGSLRSLRLTGEVPRASWSNGSKFDKLGSFLDANRLTRLAGLDGPSGRDE